MYSTKYRHGMAVYYSSTRYFFVKRIESDLEASRATEELGYSQIQCAVGDKWILWHAFYNQLQSKLGYYLEMIDDQEFHHLVQSYKLVLENKQALILLPEIFLTTQFKKRFDLIFYRRLQNL